MEVGFYDSDDNKKDHYFRTKAYTKLYSDMISACLTCRKPVVIYNNNVFTKKKLQNKYLPILQDKLAGKYRDERCVCADTGSFTDIGEIIKVTRKEIRYEWGNFPHKFPSNGMMESDQSEVDEAEGKTET